MVYGQSVPKTDVTMRRLVSLSGIFLFLSFRTLVSNAYDICLLRTCVIAHFALRWTRPYIQYACVSSPQLLLPPAID